jgi:cytochrome c biogenesis protein CcdA
MFLGIYFHFSICNYQYYFIANFLQSTMIYIYIIIYFIVWVMFYHNMQKHHKPFFGVDTVSVQKQSPNKTLQCDYIKGDPHIVFSPHYP